MLKRIVSIVALMLCVAAGISQATRFGRENKRHILHLQPVSLNNTNSDGVSRLSINLIGLSHTSSRIDSAKIFMGDGRIFSAIDIDGVDFMRYFQWEDDGVIPVEIDFPAVKGYNGEDTLVVYTVHGQYRTPLNLTK